MSYLNLYSFTRCYAHLSNVFDDDIFELLLLVLEEVLQELSFVVTPDRSPDWESSIEECFHSVTSAHQHWHYAERDDFDKSVSVRHSRGDETGSSGDENEGSRLDGGHLDQAVLVV